MNRAGRGGAPNPMDPETLTEMLKGNILNMVVSLIELIYFIICIRCQWSSLEDGLIGHSLDSWLLVFPSLSLSDSNQCFKEELI